VFPAEVRDFRQAVGVLNGKGRAIRLQCHDGAMLN
jgi:hypothetical protein